MHAFWRNFIFVRIVLFAPEFLWNLLNRLLCLDFTTYNEYDATVENELAIKKNLVVEAFDNKDQTALLEAISSYDKMTATDIIDSYKARCLFQKAEALDLLAQLERSNTRLEQAISTFNEVLMEFTQKNGGKLAPASN